MPCKPTHQSQNNVLDTRVLFIWFYWNFPAFYSLSADTAEHDTYNCNSYFTNKTLPLLYRVSQEERTKLWEGVPYVKLYRYNPKHLHPKLNGYGDNGKRSLKVWQLLHTYWLPNSYWNWQEYVVFVMLISVLNIKVTCEWHKAVKLNYKNNHTAVVFVLRFPSNWRRQQLSDISPTSLHSNVS